jgi:metacaspase-1
MNLALLCGINSYDQSPLQGCVNDVENMRKLLTECCRFSVMSIKTLKNEQATKERILKELEFMVKNMQEGDHGVFHFSGHGSQVPASDPHEPDFMTEILCPYDFDWVPKHYITDDEVHDVCTQLNPGATLDIFLDSCHSGDMLREPAGLVSRFIPYPGGIKDISKPFSLDRSETELNNVALWSGCTSNQTSADTHINNTWQGALTWAFVKNATCGLDRHHIHLGILYDLGYRGYEQTPVLECSMEMRAKKLFAKT